MPNTHLREFLRCVLLARLPIDLICLHSLCCDALNCIHIWILGKGCRLPENTAVQFGTVGMVLAHPVSGSLAGFFISSIRRVRRLQFHHFKIVFAGIAIRAGPVGRHIFPAGARRDAVFRPAGGLVIDKSANQAHIGFHRWLGG